MAGDFQARQREFAAYLKNPDRNPPPADVPEERMALYRELFYNNIDNCLSGNFPVLKAILGDSDWRALVKDFYAVHRCATPYFAEIAEEFLDYLRHERDHPADYPFLAELAHYEWAELALAVASDEPVPSRPDRLEARACIRLSPLAWPLAYRFPVHRIGPDFLPGAAPAQPTFLLVYRDPLDVVRFMEITPVTYRLLEIIREHEPIRVDHCLRQLAAELPHFDPGALAANGLPILAELAEKAVIGTAG